MVSYRLIRSDRKTLGIRITPSGEVVVRSPRRMPEREIRRIIQEKEPWILAHLEKIRSSLQSIPLEQADIDNLAQEALQWFPDRISHYASLLGVDYDRVTIRCQKSRWGSCSTSGNLNFNCLLMLCPEEVRDYVVVHELCHRLEMNHSKAFWAHVASILPDYTIRQKWLKDNGQAILARVNRD